MFGQKRNYYSEPQLSTARLIPIVKTYRMERDRPLGLQ